MRVALSANSRCTVEPASTCPAQIRSMVHLSLQWLHLMERQGLAGPFPVVAPFIMVRHSTGIDRIDAGHRIY